MVGAFFCASEESIPGRKAVAPTNLKNRPEWANVQVLLDQSKGQGMVVSCYCDTSVAEGFEPHWLQPFKTEASRIRQQLTEDHQARLEFDRNLDAVRSALESPESKLAKGMAVFSSTRRGFFLALPSSEPYENRLVVDEDPYVVPLLEADFRQRAYLVVLTDTHRANWYAAGPGGVRAIGAIDETVPARDHAQSYVQRYRMDRILHFHKELVERIEDDWGKYPYRGIILLGEHEVLEQFRKLLPPRLATRVVREAAQAWSKEPAGIAEETNAVIEIAQEMEESRALAELDRRIHEATAVAAGSQEVIDALRDGQVGALVMGPDPGEKASRCTGCHSLFAMPHTACPYCNATCETGNLWQEILAFAIKHGIWVHRVKPSETLIRHGGVAALLARDEPQWAVASAGAAQATLGD
jgi:rubrerythrin